MNVGKTRCVLVDSSTSVQCKVFLFLSMVVLSKLHGNVSAFY